MLRGQLEGAEKVPLLPGRYGEGSQKSRELGRFPSGDLELRIGQVDISVPRDEVIESTVLE
jgi:hypothetical protein